MKGLFITLIICCLSTFNFAQNANQSNLGQNPEAQKLLDAAIEAGAFTGAAAGFMVDGKSTWSSGAGYSDEANKKEFDAQTKSRIASITKPMAAIAIMLFGNAIVNNTLITESTRKMMLQDTGLKTVGNIYGLGWYLYGQNPKYGNVFGQNDAQTGASAHLMILPDVKTSIIVLANTSGSMQRASNITVQLFDIAAKTRS